MSDPRGPTSFLVTCEHGGNRVEPPFQPWFESSEDLLQSHRGHDLGALQLAQEMADALKAPLVSSTISRLVVDLNRSVGHPGLHSELMRQVPEALRSDAVARYYLPYRRDVEGRIFSALEQGQSVVHISSHSFTPVLNGEVRNADIGLLYDPGRPGEVDFCRRWQQAVKATAPAIRVRRNYPYTGKSDGLCTSLRRRFPADRYVGIELEVNQKYVLSGGEDWRELRRSIVGALLHAAADRLPA